MLQVRSFPVSKALIFKRDNLIGTVKTQLLNHQNSAIIHLQYLHFTD